MGRGMVGRLSAAALICAAGFGTTVAAAHETDVVFSSDGAFSAGIVQRDAKQHGAET